MISYLFILSFYSIFFTYYFTHLNFQRYFKQDFFTSYISFQYFHYKTTKEMQVSIQSINIYRICNIYSYDTS